MSSKNITALKLLLFIVIPLLVALLAFRFMSRALVYPADPENKTEISIEIQSGMSFRDVCRLLKEKGVVRYSRSLDLLARLKGKSTTEISAGEYLLSPSMEPAAILDKLVAGDVVKRVVTVTEGMSIYDIAKVIAQSGLISGEEFLKAAKDPALLMRAGIAGGSFEGYLFPETYYFSRPVTAQQIVWRMLEQGEKKWAPEFTDQADKLGLSRHEILTIASMIEKESSRKVEEQPLISSVFHNRLKQGMKLQSDPTVIYGIPNFNGNLTKEDLQNPHSYNTYVNFGLPPGPIGNPGLSAIQAALNPAQSTFLFFVSDGTGGHTFSSTLNEHNDAVAKLVARETGK